MNWNNVKQFIADGQAFIPMDVKDRGECVLIYFKDGSTEIVDRGSATFLKKILTFFGASVTVNRERYGALVSKKQLVPIALSYGYTLIPFMARESIVGRQSRIGWVVAKEITNIKERTPDKTIIELTNHEILAYHSRKFCLDQLKNAKWIESFYGEIHEPHRKQWPVSGVSLYEIAYL